MAKTIVIELC